MSSIPESFDLPVWYHGNEMEFPATLLVMGYTHKIRVTVEGTEVLFEPDEERNYRATINPDQAAQARQLKPDLLQAISETLTDLLGTP